MRHFGQLFQAAVVRRGVSITLLDVGVCTVVEEQLRQGDLAAFHGLVERGVPELVFYVWVCT